MSNAEFRYVTTAIYQPKFLVTNVVSNSAHTQLTYTCDNTFTVGDLVTITGATPSQFNKTNYAIISCNATSFTIASTSTGTFTGGGVATTYNKILSELPFTGVSFTQQLNSVGTFQGHVLLSGINSTRLNAYEGTIPGKTILWVLYTDPESSPAVSIPVWSGVIWAREYDSSSQSLSISAQEMMSLYNRRRINDTLDYSTTNYDPAYIAQNLMSYAEGLNHGNTGLTQNIATTGYLTKKLYNDYELKSVYQAIKDLAQNYFDFTIKPYIDFDTGKLINQFTIGTTTTPGVAPAPYGGFLGRVYSSTDPYALMFQFPGNLISYSFPEDASSAANQLFGLGYGANNSKIIAISQDPTKIGFSPTADWPLLEDTANFTDIGQLQLLKDLTNGQQKAISYPPTTIQIVIPPYIDPLFPTYSIGDEVRLDIKDDYFPSGISFGADNDPLRIVAITVEPGENGPSRVILTLTRRLQAGDVS